MIFIKTGILDYEEDEDEYAEDISDWLSDKYEFCNKGFNLVDTERDLELE